MKNVCYNNNVIKENKLLKIRKKELKNGKENLCCNF